MYYQIWMLLVAVGLWVERSSACSCSMQHPQAHFCNADFVMRVRLRAEGEMTYKKEEYINYNAETGQNDTMVHRQPIEKKYSVQVRKIFKLKENDGDLEEDSKVTTLYTAPYGALCGVELNVRTYYLVAGMFQDGRPTLMSCNWNTPWAWVTKMQRKYLRSIYSKNCGCQIEDRFQSWQPELPVIGAPVVRPDSCKRKPFTADSTCRERNSACIKDKNSTTGGCKWHRNKYLKKCRADARNPSTRYSEP